MAFSTQEARKEYVKKWHAANRVRVAEHKRKWLLNNPAKMKECRAAWRAENGHRTAETTRRSQARAVGAVPGWSDSAQCADFYKIAQNLTAATGVKVEVDHIVPLKSALVCGLHCEDNLRVVRMKANRAKRNHFWPDMPV